MPLGNEGSESCFAVRLRSAEIVKISSVKQQNQSYCSAPPYIDDNGEGAGNRDVISPPPRPCKLSASVGRAVDCTKCVPSINAEQRCAGAKLSSADLARTSAKYLVY